MAYAGTSSTITKSRAAEKADKRFSRQATDPFRAITDDDLTRYAQKKKQPARVAPVSKKQRAAQKKQEIKAVKKAREQEAKATQKAREQEAKDTLRAERKEIRAQKHRENAPRRHKVYLALATVFVLLIFTGALIYPSAQEYYKTVRTQAKLQAEYDALTVRNEQIQSNIDNLNTDAGIEDQARQYGYVVPGENAVSVTNSGDTGSSTSLPEAVDSQDISAPDTWYTKALDKVFGVDS